MLGAAVAAAFAVLAIAFVVRPTRLRFALAAFALAALPASNLLPIHPAVADRFVFAGEHLAYAPLAVLGPLIAGLAERSLGGRVPRADAAVALAAAVAALAWAPSVLARQRDLADAESTYRATLAHSPSPRACFNLGVTLLERGRNDEAARVYERCVEIAPHDAEAFVQLGAALQRAGRRDEAERAFVRALELDPSDPYAWSNYASLQASAGRYADARVKWERALEIQAGFAPAVEGLAKLTLVEKKLEPSESPTRALPPPS
jgi:tetratricopeptide (TPR) repeat protein